MRKIGPLMWATTKSLSRRSLFRARAARTRERRRRRGRRRGTGGRGARPKGVAKIVYNKNKARDIAVLEHDGYLEGEVEAYSWVFDAHGVPAKEGHVEPEKGKWKKTPDPNWKREEFKGESKELKLKLIPMVVKLKRG
jgi:hypothetical protein